MSFLRLVPGRAEFRRVGDEVVILDLQDRRYLALNHTGSSLWSLLPAGATEEQLREHLVKEFAVDAGAARKDLESFVADLEERGLIERSS